MGQVSVNRIRVNLKVVWQGEAADAGQVAEAVAAARQAFPSWARLPFAARQAIIEKFAAPAGSQ
ncbi:aldehyde dehydrogenase family protein [Klebsiella pneumoniae]